MSSWKIQCSFGESSRNEESSSVAILAMVAIGGCSVGRLRRSRQSRTGRLRFSKPAFFTGSLTIMLIELPPVFSLSSGSPRVDDEVNLTAVLTLLLASCRLASSQVLKLFERRSDSPEMLGRVETLIGERALRVAPQLIIAALIAVLLVEATEQATEPPLTGTLFNTGQACTVRPDAEVLQLSGVEALPQDSRVMDALDASQGSTVAVHAGAELRVATRAMGVGGVGTGAPRCTTRGDNDRELRWETAKRC